MLLQSSRRWGAGVETEFIGGLLIMGIADAKKSEEGGKK